MPSSSEDSREGANRMTAGNPVKSMVSQPWLYDIWSKRNSWGLSCIIRCRVTFLASTFQMPAAIPSPAVTTKPVSRHWQISLQVQNQPPQLRTTNLKEPSPFSEPIQTNLYHLSTPKESEVYSVIRWHQRRSKPGNKWHRKGRLRHQTGSQGLGRVHVPFY